MSWKMMSGGVVASRFVKAELGLFNFLVTASGELKVSHHEDTFMCSLLSSLQAVMTQKRHMKMDISKSDTQIEEDTWDT